MNTKEVLSKMFEENIRPQLTDEEINMLMGYTTFQSCLISDHLLSQNSDPEHYMEWIKNTIVLLKKAIKLSPLPFDLTVYHGTGDAIFNHQTVNEYKKNHETFTNKTFLSTSLLRDVAHSFSFNNTGSKNVLVINLPMGYPALWLTNISLNRNEEELVLLNDQEFIIGDTHEEGLVTYSNVYPKTR